MKRKSAVLHGDWRVLHWKDGTNVTANWKTGQVYMLDCDSLFVLRCCDGHTDFSSPVFLPRHLKLLDEFSALRIVEECDIVHNSQSICVHNSDNPVLLGVQWALTRRCNLNCRHCFMNSPGNNCGELDLSELSVIIDRLERANVVSVSLTGGEPFCAAHFKEIVVLLSKKHIHISEIFTNGTLISRNFLKLLDEIGIRPTFRISFDGTGYHDRMRGQNGVEALVLENIDKLIEAGHRVHVSTCVDRDNISDIYKTYEVMKELKPNAWGIGRVHKMGCGKNLENTLSIDEIVPVCKDIQRRWIKDGRPFTIGLDVLFSGYRDGSNHDNFGKLRSDDYACSACRKWLYITPEAKVLPCMIYEDIGCEKDDFPSSLALDFEDIMNDINLRSFLDIKRNDVIAQNPECDVCSFFKYCGTGCRASAYMSGGNVLSKDHELCELWKSGYKQQFLEFAEQEK